MRFSSDFIESVRDANNIVDIISQHSQLKPMSGGYMGRCPFPDHQEKTPSFSVSESKQVYHCFGCHKKGNIFTFIQEFMGFGFPEAVEYLALRANITMPEFNKNENEAQDLVSKKKKELLNVNRLAAQFFVDQLRRLPKDHPAKVYAYEKRGLSEEIITEFQIGYAPEEWDGLVQYLKAKGVSLALAQEARLVKAKNEGTGCFDIFRDRLMFPIFNPMGEPIAFGGRVISQGEPKYLNSGETPVFHKGKILYGLFQTARFARSEDQIIIVEGYMDLVSLYQNGIKNVAATMGTSLTAEHGRSLQRMTKNVIVLFDGDQAGQAAAERSLPILLSANVHPKGLILPEGMDPDDFIKNQGPENLKKMIHHSVDLFSMVLGLWTQGYRAEASEKVKISDTLKPIFDSIADDRLKSLYVSETAKKLVVDENWLRQAIRPVKSQNKTQVSQGLPQESSKVAHLSKSSTIPATESDTDKIILSGASKHEALLLSLCLKNINNFNILEKSNAIIEVLHPGIRQLLEKTALICRQTPEKFDKLAGLLSSFVDLPELLFPPQTFGGSSVGSAQMKEQAQELQLLNDCIKRIREQSLRAKAEKLALEIKIQPSPEKLEQFMNIQRDRLALNKES